MNTSATTPTPEPVAGLSPVARITNIFFSPSTTFADLKRKPSWWVAWLLISVVSLIFVFAMQQKIGFDRMVQNEINASPKTVEQLDKMPPEQREQRMQISTTVTKYISYGTPVFILIVNVIIAAVLMATFNFGFGTEVSFGLSMALVFYSFIPEILKSILGAISLYAGADPDGFNPRNPIATNLGFFISRTDHPVLYSLGSSVDIFGIWVLILLGIGFATVSKVKRGTAISVIAGWYILIALAGAGWVAAFA